ncbi:MAG: Na+/glucose cotransporter, partial [Kiritimatiellae bacterium]|nr:Na+/glucose cotransporter [Kiritimatiellia bacterium]
GYALLQDFYFSGLLLLTSILVIVVASFTAPAPDPKRIASLTFATLGDDFKRENRASWTWVDVVTSSVVVGVIVACYVYFWNWLG